MFEINHEIDINAPASSVWAVITDFDSYSQWNPFVVSAKSNLKAGEPIDMKVKLLGPVQRQVEIILDVNEGKGFSYCMKPFPLGALSSQRSHRIIDLGDGRSHYSSHFHLQGWMMPLIRGLMRPALERGFSGMSVAIKERAETLAEKPAA
ncbi:MAG: SRPBCC family protein [Oceanococcus sp.]